MALGRRRQVSVIIPEKIVQWEQENPASNSRGMIDDFRLRGSRTWRRMGGHLTKGGWRTQVAHQVAHAFDNHNASLSEGAPSLLWSGPCLESLTGGGLARIPRVLRGKALCGGGAHPRLARRVGAPHERGGWWRERPPLFDRWCGTGERLPAHTVAHGKHSPGCTSDF